MILRLENAGLYVCDFPLQLLTICPPAGRVSRVETLNDAASSSTGKLAAFLDHLAEDGQAMLILLWQPSRNDAVDWLAHATFSSSSIWETPNRSGIAIASAMARTWAQPSTK